VVFDRDRITNLLESAVDDGTFPGAVCLAFTGGKTIYHEAVGHSSVQPTRKKMAKSTIFDISSLTKPIACATAAAILVNEGRLEIDAPVREYLGGPRGSWLADVPVRRLLSHTSGLRAWAPLYKAVDGESMSSGVMLAGTKAGKDLIYRLVEAEVREYPPGARSVYSDLGFILLTEIIEGVSRLEFGDFCENRILKPLHLKDTFFRRVKGRKPETPALARFAATEACPWRGEVLRGIVHDENAYAMGGASGHAGLFSTASNIGAFLAGCLRAYKGGRWIVCQGTMQEFLTKQEGPDGGTYALGWDTPTPGASSSGRHFSPDSVGHLGYTGTSMWLDLKKETGIILLTNRVHPSRENNGIRAFRPVLHDAIMEMILQTGA
jgi:CubicO group peptidase (beta-lactamase class C family)